MNEPDSDNVELGGHDDTGEEMVKKVNDTTKKKEYASVGGREKGKTEEEIMVLEYVIPPKNSVSEEFQEEKGNQERDQEQLVNEDEINYELCNQQCDDSHQDSDMNIDQESPQNQSYIEEKKSLHFSSGKSKELSSITSRKDKRSVAPSSEKTKRNSSVSTEEDCNSISPSNVEGKRLPPGVGKYSCDEGSKDSGSPSSEEVKKSVHPYSKESKMQIESGSPSSEEVKKSVPPYSKESKIQIESGSTECEEQPDFCNEERTSVLNTEDSLEENNLNTSSAGGSIESSHDKNNQLSENFEQQKGITNDHTVNSLQREEAKHSKYGLTSSESVPGENIKKQSHVNHLAPDVQSQVEVDSDEVDVIDVPSDNEDSPATSQSETSEIICLSMKSPEIIIPTICKRCQNIWNDRVLMAIFLGTESVTVNSKITYGAIISINNWAELHFKSEKESAVRGLLERADLGKNIGSLKISEVNHWLGSLMKTGKIKCCDVFVAVYKENPKDELLSSLIASNVGTAETPEGSKKRIAVVTIEDDAPAPKKMVKEFPETNPQAESNQIPKQAVEGNLSSLKKHPSSSSSEDTDSSSEKGSPDNMCDIPLFTKKKRSRNSVKKTRTLCSQTNVASTSEYTSEKDQMLGSSETLPKQNFQSISEENKLSDSKECMSLVREENMSYDKTSLPSKETLSTVSEKPVQHKENDDTLSICKTTLLSASEEKSAVSIMSGSEETQEEKSPADSDITDIPHLTSGSSETVSTDPSKSAVVSPSNSSMSMNEPLSPDTSSSSLDVHNEGTNSVSDEMKEMPKTKDSVQPESKEYCMEATNKQAETVSTDPSKSAVVSLSNSSMSMNEPLSPDTSSSSLDVDNEGTNSLSDEMKEMPKTKASVQPESKENSMEAANKQTELFSASLEEQPVVQDINDLSCSKLTHQISETSYDSPGDSPRSNEATQPILTAIDQPNLAVSICNLPAPCELQVMPVESVTSGQLAIVQSTSGMVTTSASVIDSYSKLEKVALELPEPLVPAIPNPIMFAPSTMIADSVQQEPFGNCSTEPQQHSGDESLIERSVPQQQVSDKEQPHLQLQQSVSSDCLSYRDQNSDNVSESNSGGELFLSDSDISAEDENRVSFEPEDISSVNLCMTLGLDVSTLDTYCSSIDVKTITNGVMVKNPLERYKYSFSHYSVLKERSALSGFAREAFDLLPFESDNCHPLMPGNKGRERFLTNRELLTLQNICILNAESPDVDLFYRILVQILLTRNRVLLVPNSRTLLLVAEKLRRNFNRAKSKGAYAEFLSQDWDVSSIYTAEDLWLAKLEQPKEPTVRNILSLFCLWKNLDKNIPDLSLSEALSKICRNINFDNTNNIGMCIKLYARFCSFLYEEKNNSLAEFFLNQPFIGSETPTSRKVLVDFMAAKFSMDMTNLSSTRSLNIAEKEVQGAVQKCLSAEKAIIHSPDARKEEEFRLSIASLKEKLNRYKEVNSLLVQRITVAEKRKQEVLKSITDSKAKKLVQELRETLTNIHHTLDKQNWDSNMEGTDCSKKNSKLDHSTDIQSPTEVYSKFTLGEDVPQGVQEVIYELLTYEVDVNQVGPVIHTIMNKVAEEEVPSLPSLTWIRNFARLNGFKMNSN